MEAYLIESPDLEYQFFSKSTKFQKHRFKKIYWILTSLDGPTKFPYNGSLYVEVHCIVIEYENGKIKSVHFLVQLIDLEVPND